MEEFEFEKIIRDNLSPIQDIELILLKGHLIMEQLITELLELSLAESSRLKTINPMFSKKLEIYLAINRNSIISLGLEKVLKDLNSIRNKLAHNLNHPKLKHLLKDWIQRASRSKINSLKNNSEIKINLIEAITHITAFLSGAISAQKNAISIKNIESKSI